MVTVALYVRLEAKPGKETEVEAFLKGGLAIVQGWARPPSASSTRSRTRRGDRPTSPAGSRPRSCRRPASSWRSRRGSRRWTSSRPSCPS